MHAFLEKMKALNEYRLSHEAATAEAARVLGPENMDLFRAFVRLLVPDADAPAGDARDDPRGRGSPAAAVDVVLDATR